MSKLFWPTLTILVIGALILGSTGSTRASDPGPVWDVPSPPILERVESGLLVNGNMDEMPFYWAYPNHYVAGGWNRWWIHGTVLPEYDDIRLNRSSYYVDGGHSQVYFKWGANYTAGIYQVVGGLTACTPYRLSMWARNHSLEAAQPHARIGLDPQGTQITLSAEDSAVHGGLPLATVWSREQTALAVWEQLTVDAEPLGNKLTAILYASPTRPDDGLTYYFDTFWDAGSLVQTSYPGGQLPAPANFTPDAFATQIVTATQSGQLTITWNTPEPVMSQVRYRIVDPAPAITSTLTLTPTAYLPWVANDISLQQLDLYTSVESAPSTAHQAVIDGLTGGQTVYFAVLSRHLVGGACQTTPSAVFRVPYH